MKERSIITIIAVLFTVGMAMGQNIPNPKSNIKGGGLSNFPGDMLIKTNFPGDMLLKTNFPGDMLLKKLMSDIDESGNSDYVIRVPLNLQNLNLQVKRVELVCTMTAKNGKDIIGLGTAVYSVSTNHNIKKTAEIPVYLDKESRQKGEKAQHYSVDVFFVNQKGRVVRVGNSKKLPYWARVNTSNGQNSLLKTEAEIPGENLNKLFPGGQWIGVKGTITHNAIFGSRGGRKTIPKH